MNRDATLAIDVQYIRHVINHQRLNANESNYRYAQANKRYFPLEKS
jgi:hypothetical protein